MIDEETKTTKIMTPEEYSEKSRFHAERIRNNLETIRSTWMGVVVACAEEGMHDCKLHLRALRNFDASPSAYIAIFREFAKAGWTVNETERWIYLPARG